MHSALLFVSAVACSGVTAWIVSTSNSAVASPESSEVTPGVDLTALNTEIRELREHIDAVRLQAEDSQPSQRVAASPGVAAEDIAEIVRRLVQEDALIEDAIEELESWPGGMASASSALQRILDLGVDSAEARELWEEAEKNDQLHALLEEMERHMESVPESANKHFERARAYYSAARVRPWNMKGNWWVDSDDAFAKALELDPNHWEARYTKAHNQSFWPTAYGGQAEAIRHFEILVDQQGGSTAEPKYAKTYLWLGNLYDQQGKSELAAQAWNQGLALFPDNDYLKKKLESLGF